MKVLYSAGAMGLVPVPAGQNGTDSSQYRAGGLQWMPGELEGASQPCPPGCGKWGRVTKWLSLALNALFATALAVGPSSATGHCAHKTAAPVRVPASKMAEDARITGQSAASPLRPVTFGMRPAPETKLAAFVPPDLLGERQRPAATPANVMIDVIVAYTSKAARHYGDIKRELIELAIEEANESFRVSNLGHIKLRLVHAYRTGYVEEGTHFEHVWRFADKGDGYMDEIHGLRDRYRADVAILIVDDAQGCGLSTRVQADADEAFAVVHHECAAATYTLAHEVGHLIGARHELGYVNGAKWRDIMSYKDTCGGCPRLAVWSNPMVLVDGEPAGTTVLNNARIIAEQAARVAAFR
jgi:hypothetical protein